MRSTDYASPLEFWSSFNKNNPFGKEVKFIDRDPPWYTRGNKDVINLKLHPNNLNREYGIQIPPEMRILMVKKHKIK